MGIRFLCPNGHKLNVKADLAGKRGRCPDCGAPVVIPAETVIPVSTAEPALAVGAAAGANAGTNASASLDALPAAVWYLRTPIGEQLGPASEEQFCSWITTGRVTADAHVWRDGWTEWRLAREAADELPLPLERPPAPKSVVAAPVVADPSLAEPADMMPQLDLDLTAAEPLTAEPLAADASILPVSIVSESTRPIRQRRSKRVQLALAIVMLAAVIVLAAVLVWVVRNNANAPPQTSRWDGAGFGAVLAANC